MNIYLIINEKKDLGLSVTSRVIDFLSYKKAKVYVDKCLFEKLSDEYRQKILVASPELEQCEIDVAIVIGGDGTILRAAKQLCRMEIPIVGINLGKVGYMAELEVNECDLLSVLFSDDEGVRSNIRLDERMMLSCKLIRGDSIVFEGECLNEAVIAKGDISRMIDLGLSVDGEILADYQCDGVIASTPTGSTAYSMSAGGAIIDPKIECISVLPLSPYLSINSSPIIFSKDSKIEFVYKCVRHNSAYLSIDGGDSIQLCDGDKIVVSESPYTTKLLRFKKTDFYKLLNAKLANRISELAKRN